jgi:cysteinyl-tRNA synthetase
MHMEFLKIEGEEMHKSLGNMVTLRELLQKGWSPRTVRLFLMSANYREVLNLTDESLSQAQSNIAKLDEFVRRLQSVTGGNSSASKEIRLLTARLLKDFRAAMDDDLKTPIALAALFTFVRGTNSLIDQNKLTKADADEILDSLCRLDTVFGFMKFEGGDALSSEQQALIQEREEARKRRDFEKSDQIRETLKKQGVVIEDTSKGTVWKRV